MQLSNLFLMDVIMDVISTNPKPSQMCQALRIGYADLRVMHHLQQCCYVIYLTITTITLKPNQRVFYFTIIIITYKLKSNYFTGFCFFRFIFIALVFCLSYSAESFRTNRFCSKKISYKYSLVIFNCATERKFKVLT
jgi:hypothetical protein